MLCQRFNIPNVRTSIANIIANQLPNHLQSQVGVSGFRSDVLVQAPTTNTGQILVGDLNNPENFIVAGGSLSFFRTDLNTLNITGTTGDQVIIWLIGGYIQPQT
jgi:hypothetical protein